MQARDSSTELKGGRGQRGTFTEAGRRAQIVAAAIEVIAELGYHRASFARIAERAGLSSTGMISYHFNGRGDLMREVVSEVIKLADGYLRPRIEAQTTYAARLRAFIEGNLELCADHPRELAALVEVIANSRGEDPGMVAFLDITEGTLAIQVEQLRKAQAAGEFGDFEPWTMIRAIRAAIDDVVRRAVQNPALDVRAAGRELADLFDRATRRTA